MPSYRFCRPDDVPFLVRAVNDCFDVHFPERPRLTFDGFRREMKHLDLWPSSSMVAAEESVPVAVLTGTKRDDEVLVSRIGVRPGAERQGHCGHLLTSLGQKQAVLGPPRLAVEVPASRPGVLAFFRAMGWTEDGVYTDWVRNRPDPVGGTTVEPGPRGLAGLIGPVTVAELDAAGALTAPSSGNGTNAPPAWERRIESLRNRNDALQGAALASPERIEGWLLWEETEDALDVAAWGMAPGASDGASDGASNGDRGRKVLEILLRHLATLAPATALRLVKTGEGEVPEAVARTLGLHPTERHHRLTTKAEAL